jgi:hypothetical protein
VINTAFGGFALSASGKAEYCRRAGLATIWSGSIERTDPHLVATVEALGGALKVVEVPDGVEWTIEDYDGREWVAEKHRTWS